MNSNFFLRIIVYNVYDFYVSEIMSLWDEQYYCSVVIYRHPCISSKSYRSDPRTHGSVHINIDPLREKSQKRCDDDETSWFLSSRYRKLICTISCMLFDAVSTYILQELWKCFGLHEDVATFSKNEKFFNICIPTNSHVAKVCLSSTHAFRRG